MSYFFKEWSAWHFRKKLDRKVKLTRMKKVKQSALLPLSKIYLPEEHITSKTKGVIEPTWTSHSHVTHIAVKCCASFNQKRIIIILQISNFLFVSFICFCSAGSCGAGDGGRRHLLLPHSVLDHAPPPQRDYSGLQIETGHCSECVISYCGASPTVPTRVQETRSVVFFL